MAINYTKVGWDTSKYVKPTNMNQMDDGIKAACDGVDAHDTAIAGKVSKSGDTINGKLTISINTTSNAHPLTINNDANVSAVWGLKIQKQGADLGYFGADTSSKPVYYNAATYALHEIALKDDMALKYKTFSATTSANAQSKLGYYVSMDVRMANYTPISAFVEGSSAFQGFCTLNNSGTLYLWAASADTYTVKVFYAKTDTLVAG